MTADRSAKETKTKEEPTVQAKAEGSGTEEHTLRLLESKSTLRPNRGE